jgi:Disulphide bond corrector protein DsbC
LPPLWPQSSFGSAHLTLETPAPLRLKAGETAPLALRFRLAPGVHTNSNKPSDEFLIPLKLTWDADAVAPPLSVEGTEYPPGKLEKYSFSEKPLSVYSGEFIVTTRFKAPSDAAKGQRTVKGKLRFQACNNTMCFPPRNLAVEASVVVQ